MIFTDPLLEQLARQGGSYGGSRELGGAGGPLPDFRDDSVQAYNERLQLQANAQRFTSEQDAQQLQQAYALRQGRGSTPTDGGSGRAGAPMGSSIRASKALSKSTMLGGIPLSDEDQQNLDVLAKDDSVRPDQFEDALQKIASAHARNQSVMAAATKTQNEQADAQANAQQKFQFAQSLRADPNFADEESRNKIRALVSDPKTSMSQLRIAAANIAKEKANSAREDERDQTAQTRQQLSDLKPQVAEKRSQLTKEHLGIADLVDLPDEQVVQQMSSRLQDGSISADDKQALLAYRGSRADQQNLEGQLTPKHGQQSGKQIDHATALQSYQQAGGDPNKARAL